MSGGYLIELDETTACVVAHGELDLAAVDDLRAALRRAVRDGQVLLDLAPVTFLDSSAAGVILDLLEEGAIPTLRSPRRMAAKVLRLLGLGPTCWPAPSPTPDPARPAGLSPARGRRDRRAAGPAARRSGRPGAPRPRPGPAGGRCGRCDAAR